MSYAFRRDGQPITVKALFSALDKEISHITWFSNHPAVVVEDKGDGTASVAPADPSVATDAQVFAVARFTDGSEKSSAPFGVQVGHDDVTGSVQVVDDPNVPAAPADEETPAVSPPDASGALDSPDASGTPADAEVAPVEAPLEEPAPDLPAY